jgi:hypothetical protein
MYITFSKGGRGNVKYSCRYTQTLLFYLIIKSHVSNIMINPTKEKIPLSFPPSTQSPSIYSLLQYLAAWPKFSIRSSKSLYDWRSVSQNVLVSSTLVGLAIRYYFLSEGCCLKLAVLLLWGALSDERTGLQFAMQSLNGPSRAEPITILYCLIWDSPNLEGQVPVFISPRNRLSQLYPRALGLLLHESTWSIFTQRTSTLPATLTHPYPLV